MIKVKNVLLTALVAAFMVGGIATVEGTSVNANAQTVHVHHAKRHTKKHHKKASKKHAKKHSKKRVVKKHVKKHGKKHVRKVAKKHVAKKHLRKIAKKHVRKTVKKHARKASQKKLTNRVANTNSKHNTTNSNGGYGEIKQDHSSWLYNKGDGSYASVKAHVHELAKHSKSLRDQIKEYGDSKAELMTEEVGF